MDHFPNSLITFMSQLTLDFGGRECFLGRSEQVNSHELIKQRKFAAMKQGVGGQSGTMMTFCTNQTDVVFIPILVRVATSFTLHTIFLPEFTKILLTGFFILKCFVEI